MLTFHLAAWTSHSGSSSAEASAKGSTSHASVVRSGTASAAASHAHAAAASTGSKSAAATAPILGALSLDHTRAEYFDVSIFHKMNWIRKIPSQLNLTNFFS